jgi:hypothetical protein
MPVITLCSPQCIIKHTDEVTNVILDVLPFGRRPMEHIEQFKIETEAIPSYYDVFGVKISMILFQVVNFLNPFGEGVKQVKGLKGTEPFARLFLQKVAEEFPFNIF